MPRLQLILIMNDIHGTCFHHVGVFVEDSAATLFSFLLRLCRAARRWITLVVSLLSTALLNLAHMDINVPSELNRKRIVCVHQICDAPSESNRK